MTEPAPPATHTIQLSGGTQRFYQGAVAANTVIEGHADTAFPDFETRVRYFWFYCGALAAGEYGCDTQDDFANFILGATTRAPQPPDPDNLTCRQCDESMWISDEGTSHHWADAIDDIDHDADRDHVPIAKEA